MNAEVDAVRFIGVCHDFPGVRVLDNVSFSVRQGEIHGLVGENGAGKSTLMKLLTGNYAVRQGTIRVAGDPTAFSSYADAVAHGIHMVYQELSLANDLTVAENVYIGQEPRTQLGLIDYRLMNQGAADFLNSLGVSIDPRTRVEGLSIAQKQLVEIAKAAWQRSRVLVLDEPTSALSSGEVTSLFRLLRQLREQGCCVIYISHRLDEVFEICDRVTVLRDGKYITTRDTQDLSKDELIELQVGRVAKPLHEELPGVRPDEDETPLLEVENVSLSGFLDDVSLSVHRGEILGLFGVLGSGCREVAQLLFGIAQPTAGTIKVRGQPISLTSPRQAMKAGIAYVPPNRREQGLFLDMSVERNIMSASLAHARRRLLLSHVHISSASRSWVDRLHIVCRSPQQDVATLSGGNQQKVCLAKSLVHVPRLLVANELTAGIDVGAKLEIQGIINRFCQEGNAVLLVSSDIEETVRTCSRVAVMRRGRVVGTVERPGLSKERLLQLAL